MPIAVPGEQLTATKMNHSAALSSLFLARVAVLLVYMRVRRSAGAIDTYRRVRE